MKSCVNWISVSFVVVIILLVSIFFQSNYEKIFPSKKVNNYFPKNITKFCFNNICVDKKNIWMVIKDGQEIPADEKTIDSFIKKFELVRLDNLISENPDKFIEFGFDGKNILEIDGKKIEIGKLNTSVDGTFVKEENSNKVYLISQAIDINLIKEKNCWDVKFVTNIAIDSVKKIKIDFDNKNTELTPEKDGIWKNSNMVGKLASLNVGKYLINFYPGDEKLHSFEIEGDSSTKIKLIIGKKVEKSEIIFWATTDNKYFYEISKEDFITLTENIK